MTTRLHTTAKQFLTAFKALPKAERDAFLLGLAADRALRRDLLDLATIAERQREPSRPLRNYLAECCQRRPRSGGV